MHRLLAAILVVLAVASPAAADQRMWSYDSADAETRARVDNGLTFVFDRGLFGLRVREVLATQARATAHVEPVTERDLGARLADILPAGGFERDLYAVQEVGEGPAMIRALCPGSSRGWLVFGPLRARKPVTVHALGDDPAGGAPRHCATLSFNYRGAWEIPARDPRIPLAQDLTRAPY